MIRLRKPTSKQLRGRQAEQLAVTYLQQHGLRMVTSNYHCRHGEIDLIMRDAEALVFVEVRYRRDSAHGHGFDSIDHYKQQRLWRTAEHYIAKHPKWMNRPCRFDVISIDGQLQLESVQWIQNAIMES
jgi:putative endonuclease